MIAAALAEIERRTLASFEAGQQGVRRVSQRVVGFVRFGNVPEVRPGEPALYRALLEAWEMRGEPVGPRVWEGLRQMEENA